MVSESGDASYQRRVRLRDALLRIPDVANGVKRDLYVRELAKQMPEVVDVIRHDSSAHDVFELVTFCLGRSGGLRTFWGIIKDFQAESWENDEIEAMVQAADPVELLLTEERELLLQVVARASPDIVAAAYRYAMRSRQEEWAADTSDLAAVVRRVESMNAVAGQLHAIFVFVDYIAHRCGQSDDRRLHAWIDDTAARLKFTDRVLVEELCQATRARVATARRYYFVAKIVPDRLRPQRYFLTTWRQHADDPEEPTYEAEESVPLNGVVETIHKLVRSLPRQVNENVEELIIEFIVPRLLITLAADQWLLDDEFPTEIGTEFPVVLRSLERLERAEFHGRWAVKWQWLKAHGAAHGVDAVAVVPTHGLDDARALRGLLLAGEPPAVVVMLTPLPESATLTTDAYAAGLYGGAPVMIWCRAQQYTREFRESILETIATDGPLRLPRSVYRLRLKTLQQPTGADHMERHIALAYEDFDRIPEQFRARTRFAPAQHRKAGVA